MSAHYQPSGSTAASIADSIEGAIDRGDLAPQEHLPPIRQLAADLGVNAGTVAAAYRLLQQRGLTLSDRRRGTRVRRRTRSAQADATATGRNTSTTVTRRRPASFPPGVADLASGNPDPTLVPDLLAVARRLDYRPGAYGAIPIDERLAEVARRQLTRDGIPDGGLTCAFGALDAIERVLRTSLRPGDRIAVEDPGWPALLHGVRSWGFVPVPVQLDDDGPVADSLWGALAGGAKAIVITARAQNPSGATVTADRARQISDIVRRYPGVIVVEDDHGYALALSDPPLASVIAHDEPDGQWAFVRSAGKAHGPDLRLAVLAGDPVTVSRVSADIESGAGWVSYLLQQLLAEMWSDRAINRAIAVNAATYASRRQTLLDELATRSIEAHGRTGLNVWIPVTDETSAVGTLLAGGWGVAGGAAFRLVSEPAIRVTTATLEPATAPALADAIADAVTRQPAAAY